MFSFFSKSKIKDQLLNSSNKISSSIIEIFTHKKLDQEMLDHLEESLIINDLGPEISAKIIDDLKQKSFKKSIEIDEVKKFLALELEKILSPHQKTINFHREFKPQIIIFNGVNGVGKTTTIGKIAANLGRQNKKTLIAACDTFRAAAASQLQIWANRSGAEIITANKEGEEPASVAYRALDYAKKNNFDILLIDTAGRLQNKQNLMDELKKINQVLKKIDALAPHENLLVIDATTGQNAKTQLEVFNQIVGITGLIITKLDGSAKGGVVVALAHKFKKPIYAIGIGEKIEDLQEFNAKEFAKSLVG